MNRATLSIVLLLTPIASAADDFALRDGDRVLFFGDSITQAGGYINAFEAFVLARYPDRKIAFLNHGISSETLSGTSEPDHDPRRPDAHERFTRDVAAWKPTVVIACFGMNDGNYHPFDPARFARFKAGVRRLIDRLRDEAGDPRLILLTPPPFDPYRRSASDETAIQFGYKYPAIDYDDVLTRYARWETGLATPERIVVDLHTRLNDHLKARRVEQVSFHLAPDAVHPNATGHALMALALFEALGGSTQAADLTMSRDSPPRDDVRELEWDDDGAVHFRWRAPLPLPISDDWDQESLRIEGYPDRKDRYRLAVEGLRDEGIYAITLVHFDDFNKGVGLPRFERLATRDELAKGILLNPAPALLRQASARLLQAVSERNQARSAEWRQVIRDGGPPPADWPDDEGLRNPAAPVDLVVLITPP